MAKAKWVLEEKDGWISIDCPGCGFHHTLNVNPKNSAICWTFNGNLDSPTFRDSLMNKTGKYVDPNYEDDDNLSSICHAYITDGKIQFISDSTHHLAGKTVDLPEI